jgi:hypothetical protein
VERLSGYELTFELDPPLAKRVREIRAAHARVQAAKRRRGLELKSQRTWSLAVETMNPAIVIHRLIARGFVERTGRMLGLTELGRNTIRSLPEMQRPVPRVDMP